MHPHTMLARRSFLGATVALGLSACAKVPPPLPPTIPPAPLHLSPLTDLVPAAGLDWILVTKPAELFRTSALGQPIAQLVPKANVDKLADYLGFDPRLADDAVIAGLGETTLYLLRVAHDPAQVSAKFRERVIGDVEQVTDGATVTRLGGMIGRTHRSVADLEQSVLALEVGPPGPVRAAIAFAQGKLKRAHPALAAEPLATLSKRLGDAPFLVMATNPSKQPWTKGAHGLLERATAIGLAATPSAKGLELRGLLVGSWDEPPTEALKRLEKTLGDVMGSPLGGLTGVRQPIVAPSVAGDRDAIRFELVVDPKRLAEGLRAATEAGMAEIFGPPK